MNSIEIKVPRKLIKEYLPHPEYYGDYVAVLKNGMYTDVYYDGDTGYFTITNDEEIIEYLKSVKDSKINYDLRNGVFAFRKLSRDLIYILENHEFKIITYTYKVASLRNPIRLALNQNYMFSFYFIDVAIIEISLAEDELQLTLKVFNKAIIDDDNLDVCVLILKEHFISKTP